MTRSDRTPRRRLDAETRQRAILEAAAEAFRAGAYESVSVASVARAADASEALVFRYFGSKAGLYRALVQAAVDDLAARQTAVDEALPAGSPVRDRVRASLDVYLDHIAGHPGAWAAPLLLSAADPAADIRLAARAAYVERLRGLFPPSTWRRDDYALWGYFGFLDAACLHWVESGCPGDEREHLIAAALGALQGALGDWRA